jgi:PAS domain-containing protein
MHWDATETGKIVLENSSLARIFGGKSRIAATTEFIWMDDKDRYLSVQETADWRGKARGSQLVLTHNEVTQLARAETELCIAHRRDDTLLVIVTPKGDQVYNQVNWLFGVMNQDEFDHRPISVSFMYERKIGFPEKMILGQIGLLPALV